MTHALRSGVDIEAVRVLAQHSSIRTTQLYLAAEPAHLKQAVAKVPFGTLFNNT